MDYCWKRRGAEVSTEGPTNETMLEDAMNSEDYQQMHGERNADDAMVSVWKLWKDSKWGASLNRWTRLNNGY